MPTRLRNPAPCGDLGVVAEEGRSSHASSPDHHSQHSNKPKSNPSNASSVRGAGIGNRLCFRRRDTTVPVAMQTSRVCVHLRGKGDANRIQFGGVGLRREDVQGDRNRSNSGRRAGSVRHKRVRVGVSAIGAYSRRGWCAHRRDARGVGARGSSTWPCGRGGSRSGVGRRTAIVIASRCAGRPA